MSSVTHVPLLCVDLFAQWDPTIACFDASPIAFAVCETHVGVDQVRALGWTAERWRFRWTGHIRARQAALSLRSPPTARPYGFSDVPHGMLDPSDYVHLFTGRIRRDEHTTRSEARGLSWALRHRRRSVESLDRRLVFLGDNMTFMLAVGKGRSGSKLLRGPLWEVAAFALATGCRVIARWIPSELNVEDGPSRLRPLAKRGPNDGATPGPKAFPEPHGAAAGGSATAAPRRWPHSSATVKFVEPDAGLARYPPPGLDFGDHWDESVPFDRAPTICRGPPPTTASSDGLRARPRPVLPGVRRGAGADEAIVPKALDRVHGARSGLELAALGEPLPRRPPHRDLPRAKRPSSSRPPST